MKATSRSAIVRDRHVCAVRLRELQFDRDSDRRHRSAGADPQVGSGAARPACGGRGIHGEFHVGVHRGNAAVAMFQQTKKYLQERMPAAAVDRRGAGQRTGRIRRRTRERVEISVLRDSRAGRDPRRSDMPASWCSARLGGIDVAVMSGRAHLYEGYSPAQVTYAMRVLAAARRELARVHECGRRNQPISSAGRAGADHRSHQSAGCESAGRARTTTTSGRAFPDMSEAYSERFREIARIDGRGTWAFR